VGLTYFAAGAIASEFREGPLGIFYSRCAIAIIARTSHVPGHLKVVHGDFSSAGK
jgi:hypothetical protein